MQAYDSARHRSDFCFYSFRLIKELKKIAIEIFEHQLCSPYLSQLKYSNINYFIYYRYPRILRNTKNLD
jgi:uncharacterized protein YbcV (DUF1398 family)